MAMCMNDANKKDGLVRGLILFIFRNGWNVLKKKMLNRQDARIVRFENNQKSVGHTPLTYNITPNFLLSDSGVLIIDIFERISCFGCG